MPVEEHLAPPLAAFGPNGGGAEASEVADDGDEEWVWAQIKAEACGVADSEPALASFLRSRIITHTSLSGSLSFHLSKMLCSSTLSSNFLYELFLKTLSNSKSLLLSSTVADLRAASEVDPAWTSYSHCLLNCKGFLSIQAHRVAHDLWAQNRKPLARALQSSIADVFGVEIHPETRIGKGVWLDRATGLVIGETGVVGNVSILHHVMLGRTGETYDRPYIQERFRQPKPGLLCDINNKAAVINSPDLFGCLNSLLDDMPSSLHSPDQKSSAKTIRHLTKRYPPIRDLFSNEAISKLLGPLANPGDACLDLDLQQDIIATVYHLSLTEGNKKLLAENPHAIRSLVDALRTGTLNTKSNAAAALYELSRLDSNRTCISESGALESLIRLVGEGSTVTMPNVCKAMSMLCQGLISTGAFRENAVSDGAVKVILRKVKDGIFLDFLLPVLATFSRPPSAAAVMGRMGAVACLLKIMGESGCPDSMAVESCAAILFDICSHDRDKLEEVLEEEKVNRMISNVAVWGTHRASRKAKGILKMAN